MNDAQAKQLCLTLMRADIEEQVIELLQNAGFWDNQYVWRYFGDYENNYNTIGNQQSRPDSALIEKLVNSVDARLMNECYVRGIDPEGADAPQNIRDDRGANLEGDRPWSCPLSSQGEQMTATIYAFKKGKADTYRKNEGIIFTVNGQTHGHLTPDFCDVGVCVGLRNPPLGRPSPQLASRLAEHLPQEHRRFFGVAESP